MEINQAKSVPQTASTGSTGMSAPAATGSEAGSDGFLSLMNCFMGDGSAEEIDAPDQETPPVRERRRRQRSPTAC